ncbi:MAG TPA: hypothetical protein VG096_19530 [Bryobacteraceae bacterium]|jgi:hypothetical protein|nr:hypothetical protein [Bryobacteraceae bacterium]
MNKLVTLVCALALLLAGAATARAAHKERDWKTGHVLDSAVDWHTYVTGTTTNTTGTATTNTIGDTGISTTTGNADSSTTVQTRTVRTDKLLIVGVGYVYTVADSASSGAGLLGAGVARIANRHHGCRFIVGEDVR